MTVIHYNYTEPALPEAFISINNNRIRLINGIGYLKNGTEFEIEFNNPTDYTYKAEIWINGELQKNMLVLYPKQHVYLDRFIDVPKKLKFEVYNVDDVPETKKAREENGHIIVKFYKEYSRVVFPVEDNTKNITWEFYSTNYTYKSAGVVKTTNELPQIETGRIMEGNISNQDFMSYYGLFEPTPTVIYEIKLLPESLKPAKTTIPRIREYCKCGRRRKNNANFCYYCGYDFRNNK